MTGGGTGTTSDQVDRDSNDDDVNSNDDDVKGMELLTNSVTNRVQKLQSHQSMIFDTLPNTELNEDEVEDKDKDTDVVILEQDSNSTLLFQVAQQQQKQEKDKQAKPKELTPEEEAELEKKRSRYEGFKSFEIMIRLIQEDSDRSLDSARKGQTANFIQRLTRAQNVANYFIMDIKSQLDPLLEKGDSKLTTEEKQLKELLTKKLELHQDMALFLNGLRALAKNKCRVSRTELEKQMSKIITKMKANGAEDRDILAVNAMFYDLMKDNTLLNKVFTSRKDDNTFDGRRWYQTKRFGSTEFDTSKDKLDLTGFKKRVKIEHKTDADGNTKIYANFSYSRHNIYGANARGGVFKTSRSKSELKDLQKQAKELVAVAVNAYGRGESKENPVLIRYNGYNQPEAALAVVMEYKKLAVQLGKDFHAVFYEPDDPKTGTRHEVVISSKPGLDGENEREFFLKYALHDKPYLPSRLTKLPYTPKESTGERLLKSDSDCKSCLDDKTDPDVTDEDRLCNAFEKYFENTTKNEDNLSKKERKDFDKIKERVEKMSETPKQRTKLSNP